jgi:hypothetical protein
MLLKHNLSSIATQKKEKKFFFTWTFQHYYVKCELWKHNEKVTFSSAYIQHLKKLCNAVNLERHSYSRYHRLNQIWVNSSLTFKSWSEFTKNPHFNTCSENR